MTAKTSPATTWYRVPPSNPPLPSPRLPHASRTLPSNPPPSPHFPRQPLKSPGHSPSSSHGPRTSWNNSPITPQASKPLFHSKGPPANPPPSPRITNRLLSPTSGVHPSRQFPQMPGMLQITGARTPSFPNSSSPSRLPTSTMTSSSPKRSCVASKIISPLRLKHVDRLFPVTKTPTSPVVEQGPKLISSGPKGKLKDGKVAKTNENKNRGSADVPIMTEEIKKERPNFERNKKNENGNRKAVEVKLETKVIPKRKKSEHSNSDTEMKPKRMVVKERSSSPPSRLKEIREPSTTTSLIREPSTTTTTTSLIVARTRGPKLSKELHRPTTLKITSQTRPLLLRKEQQVRSVEQRMKEMVLGSEKGGMILDGRKKEDMTVDELIKEGINIDRRTGEEIYNNEADMKTPESEKDIRKCEQMEDEDVFAGIHTTEATTKTTYNEMVDDSEDPTTDDHEPFSSDAGTCSLELIPDLEANETPHLGSNIEFDSIEMILNSVFEDEDVTKAYLESKSIEDRERSNHGDYVERSEDQVSDCSKDQTNEHLGNDSISSDCLMIVEPLQEENRSTVEDSTMQDVISITRDNEEAPTTIEDSRADDLITEDSPIEDLPTEESLPYDDHSSFPSGNPKVQMDEEEVIGGNCGENLKPLETLQPTSPAMTAKESRRKARCNEIKRVAAPRAKVSDACLRDANMARVTEARRAKKKSREEEMAKVGERRSKRKMEMERTRGGTKKSARLFVDKGSTVSGGGGSRGSCGSRVGSSAAATRQNGSAVEKKRGDGLGAPPRRPRLDNIKSTIPKPGRLPPRNNTDPVKAARPGVGSGNSGGSRGPLVGHNGPAHPIQPRPTQQQHHAEEVRRLEAEVAARVAEVKNATIQREEAGRGLEALAVLLHHLTTTYDPFSTPRLKAEVVRLGTQLTEARLNLDESCAALRRAEEASISREQQHHQETQQLHQQHQQNLDHLIQQHKQEIENALEKHRKELSQFAEEQQKQREEVSCAHSAEMEQLEGEWHNKLDLQHEKHLCALQDLNTQHTHKLRELESSRRARERELEEANSRLSEDQEALRQESRRLQETLLNDTDHRLLAVRKMCNSLKSEVDSLKTVVDMKNTEIHELRGRVVETERLGGELEAARERVRALQAKTEDLQAQMEKRVQKERRLFTEHTHLLETYQRESNTNKRLSLENEELAWKLRQREEIMSTSMPSSTLDLVSRAGPPRHQEGAASPQAAPRSPRVAVRSPSGKVSPSKCEVSKRRMRLGLSPEDSLDGDDRLQEVSFESPPPSPCVKAVVEKSNSVSFILDLNDSQSDDSFLDLPPSPRPRPQRTASLSAADRPRTPIHIRRVIHNNRANSLNRNGVHGDLKMKDMNWRPKEINGKGKETHEKSKELNGKTLEVNGRLGSRRTTSESSEGGSEVERVSPTGLAWTVPVHQPKSPAKMPSHNGSAIRKRIEHHLLEDPDEDEYEETPSGTHQFIEVVGLTSSSEAASDSELSQCDIKESSSTDSDSDSSDGERRTQKGNMGHKSGPWCPQEGAGEAMITDELLKQYAGDQMSVDGIPRAKHNGRRRLPSAPSSDSDENITPHNEGTNDVSWSEDVDITSSSEIHEL